MAGLSVIKKFEKTGYVTEHHVTRVKFGDIRYGSLYEYLALLKKGKGKSNQAVRARLNAFGLNIDSEVLSNKRWLNINGKDKVKVH